MGKRRPAGGAGGGATLSRGRQPKAANRLASLLRAAGFTPQPLEEPGPGAEPHAFALGPVAAGGPEAVAFAETQGIRLGLRIPLPAECEMTGLAPVAERALKLLGAMMLGLSSQGMQVTPVARYRGLEAVLLSVHLCPPVRGPARVRAAFERLGATAHLLGKALLEPPDRILVALRHAAGVHGVLVAAPARGDVVAVPGFEAEVRSKPRRAARRRRAGR